jgi:hypothetical protein
MALSVKARLEIVNLLCRQWAILDEQWDEWIFMIDSSSTAAEIGYLHGVASTRTQVLLALLGAEKKEVAVEMQNPEDEAHVIVRAVS